MLKNNRKPMFVILLLPLIFLLIMCLVGMSMGSIEWLRIAIIALVIVLGAWGLSRENSILINTVGLLFFIGLGASSIYPVLTRAERIGPWTVDIYAGAALALWGLIAFIYDVVKSQSKCKK